MIEPGFILNERYKLLKTLGEGGMANVYLAHDLILDRDVAVKVLRLDLQHDPDTVRRFQREAMATTELVHPNIVSIYDVGESNGQQFLVMEFVRGSDLKKYIVEHFPIPYQRVVTIMQQILSAVQMAHEHHIIHRDLKPQNILIDEDGQAKISDFGIAVALSDNSMTQTNALLGSVHYLSPEQARGSMPTKQSDIYALGIILFEMLTDSVPYEGDSAVSIALKHFQEAMPSVRDFDPRIPQALENVIIKATAKDPALRYTSAEAMSSDLETALSPARANEEKYVLPIENLDETKVLPSSLSSMSASASATSTTADGAAAASTAASAAGSKTAEKKGGKNFFKKYWPFILAGVGILFLVSILVFAFTGRGDDVRVPDMVGMTESQAKSALKSADLELGKVERKYSNKVGKNKVVSSDPDADSSVKKQSTVNIVLSRGAKKYTVADFTGQSYSSARDELIKRGFKAENIYKETIDSDQPKNTVLSQSLDVGTKVVAKDETITLTVSKGPEEKPEKKTVTMQNFVGESRDTINNFANKNGLKVTFTEQESDTVDAGLAISQSQAAGTTLEEGDSFSVVISSGKPVAQTQTVTKTVNLGLAPGKTSGRIEVYITDDDHDMGSAAQSFEITGNQQLTVTLRLTGNKVGAYRVLRDGEEIASEANIRG